MCTLDVPPIRAKAYGRSLRARLASLPASLLTRYGLVSGCRGDQSPRARHLTAAFLLAGSLGMSSAVSAQAGIAGVVREDGTGRPVPGVEVRAIRVGLTATTDTNGRFLLAGRFSGADQLLLRKIGYLPIRLDIRFVSGDTLRANATMIPSAVELAPVEVEANPRRSGGIGRDGFESRRALGFGRFYDTATLRANEHLRLDDLLRRQGGVSVESRRVDGANIVVALNPYRRNPLTGALDCPMQVYLNGIKMGTGMVFDASTPNLRDFSISSLDLVEVYRSTAQVPTEYGGSNAACGVLLLWTRQGP